MQYIETKRCECCGSTAAMINASGKLGCVNCYNTFKTQLLQTLQNLHPACVHTGKIPKSAPIEVKNSAQIQSLKAELMQAIEREDFELAVTLRDRIKKLSRQHTQD